MRMRASVIAIAALCGLMSATAHAAEADTSFKLVKTFSLDMGEGTLKVSHWRARAAEDADASDVFQIESDKLGGVPAVGTDLGSALTAFGDIRMRMQGTTVPSVYTLPPYKLTTSPLTVGPYKLTVKHWHAAARNENESNSDIYQIVSDKLKGLPLVTNDLANAISMFGDALVRIPGLGEDPDGMLGEMIDPTWINNAQVTQVNVSGEGDAQVYRFKLRGFDPVTFEVPALLLGDGGSVALDQIASMRVMPSGKAGVMSVLSYGADESGE